MDDLQQLEAWASPLLEKLQPPARRRLARIVGTALRRSQTERIRAQRNPDGAEYAPRKRAQAGQIKRRADRMFQGLIKAKHFKVEANARAVAVGFFGRVSRIARVHQEGLSDRVTPKGPSVRYERRELLGLTDAERKTVRALLIEHLSS